MPSTKNVAKVFELGIAHSSLSSFDLVVVYSEIPLLHLWYFSQKMALVNKFQRMSRTLLGVASCYSKYKNNAPLSSFQTIRQTSTTQPLCEKQEISITFVKANGEKINAKGKEGDTILDIVVNNEIDLDGYGACEGTLTCSTCHLIFPKEIYDSLPDKPTDEELDMLDLAYELTDTSRLGCQIVMTKALDGIEVRVPSTLNDARA